MGRAWSLWPIDRLSECSSVPVRRIGSFHVKVIGSDGDNGPVEHAHERDDCLAAAARVDAVAAGVHHTIRVLHEHTSKEVELVGRQAREDVVGRHEEGVAPARATVL